MSHLQSLAERHPVLGAPGLTPVGVLSALSAAAMAGFIFTSLANSRSPRLASILRGRAGDWWFALRTRAIVLLCSDEASYIAGTTPIPDGGITLTVKGYAMPPERSSSRNRLGCDGDRTPGSAFGYRQFMRRLSMATIKYLLLAAAAALVFTACDGGGPANHAYDANTAAKAPPAAPTVDHSWPGKERIRSLEVRGRDVLGHFSFEQVCRLWLIGQARQGIGDTGIHRRRLRDQQCRHFRRADEGARQ